MTTVKTRADSRPSSVGSCSRECAARKSILVQTGLRCLRGSCCLPTLVRHRGPARVAGEAGRFGAAQAPCERCAISDIPREWLAASPYYVGKNRHLVGGWHFPREPRISTGRQRHDSPSQARPALPSCHRDGRLRPGCSPFGHAEEQSGRNTGAFASSPTCGWQATGAVRHRDGSVHQRLRGRISASTRRADSRGLRPEGRTDGDIQPRRVHRTARRPCHVSHHRGWRSGQGIRWGKLGGSPQKTRASVAATHRGDGWSTRCVAGTPGRSQHEAYHA